MSNINEVVCIWNATTAVIPAGVQLLFGSPNAARGIRDNAGSIEGKSASGDWTPLDAFKVAATGISPRSYNTLSSTIISGKTISGTVQEVREANGAAFGLYQSSELVSLTAGTTVNTSMNIPAAAFILSVSARVTVTASATATNIKLIGATSGHTFTNTLAVAPTSTAKGMDGCPYISGSAEKVQLVADDDCAASGRVRIVINYMQVTPPTS